MEESQELYADALAWARSRRVILPDAYYGPLSQQARAMAFSIAGITRLDALASVQEHLAKAVQGGQTFSQWRQALLADPAALQAAMLPRHRLDNIFRTNTQSAYMRGITRQQESPGALKRRPFFQYDALNDSRTRPAHAAMDNFIAPHDDPVWQRWSPPCGYRCRCTRLALTPAEAAARGWTGSTQPVPAEPDAGFAGHPLDDEGWRGLREAIDHRIHRANTHPIWSNPIAAEFLRSLRTHAKDTPVDLAEQVRMAIGPAAYDALSERFMAQRIAHRLETHEQVALSAYTGSAHQQINQFLRWRSGLAETQKPENPWAMAALVTAIDAALAKLPVYPGAVFRGVRSGGLPDGWDSAHQPGKEVVWNAYASTSLMARTAAAHAGDDGAVFYIVNAQGRDVRDFSLFGGDESEVLIPRGMGYRIERADPATNHRITMQTAHGKPIPPKAQFSAEDMERARYGGLTREEFLAQASEQIRRNLEDPAGYAAVARLERLKTENPEAYRQLHLRFSSW